LFLFAACLACAQEACQPPSPCYTPAGIVNGASFVPGAAPGTFLTIFGSGLAWEKRERAASDPTPALGGVLVLVNNMEALVFYVSPEQVNFLAPGRIRPGPARIRVLRDGAAGPAADIALAEFAPALFQLDRETVIAQRYPTGQNATREYPARPGEIVTMYATGLGPLAEAIGDFDIPRRGIPIQARGQLRVLLNGIAVPDAAIEYAGCAPGYFGLYQINLKLPDRLDPDPEIRVALSDALSPSGIRLRTAAAAFCDTSRCRD
jgi:uncharacterized protein (TIGR03437 family)